MILLSESVWIWPSLARSHPRSEYIFGFPASHPVQLALQNLFQPSTQDGMIIGD